MRTTIDYDDAEREDAPLWSKHSWTCPHCLDDFDRRTDPPVKYRDPDRLWACWECDAQQNAWDTAIL